MKLTEKQKNLLREMVEYICEHCGYPESRVGKLQPHRMKRGYAGGKYVPSNILMLCKDCHKELHENEF